jgi:hypothetical protein
MINSFKIGDFWQADDELNIFFISLNSSYNFHTSIEIGYGKRNLNRKWSLINYEVDIAYYAGNNITMIVCKFIRTFLV